MTRSRYIHNLRRLDDVNDIVSDEVKEWETDGVDERDGYGTVLRECGNLVHPEGDSNTGPASAACNLRVVRAGCREGGENVRAGKMRTLASAPSCGMSTEEGAWSQVHCRRERCERGAGAPGEPALRRSWLLCSVEQCAGSANCAPTSPHHCQARHSCVGFQFLLPVLLGTSPLYLGFAFVSSRVCVRGVLDRFQSWTRIPNS